MSKFSGRLVKLGVAKEAVRGSGATPSYALPYTDLSFDDQVIKARSDAGMGVLADSEEAFVTTKFGGGDMEAEVRANSFGLFLYSLLGTVSTGGVVDSSYTHSFTVSNTVQSQSLAFVVEDSNSTEEYKLVMLDTLELVAELDAVLKFNASYMSKQGGTSTRTIPAVADEPKFTKKMLSMKIADTIGALAGASAISLKNLSMTFSKGVTLDDNLGTVEPEDVLNTVLGVEGTIELNYEDETYKNYMKDGDHKAVEIAWTNSDESIGAGTTKPSLTIQLPRVDFFDWEPNYALDEIVSQTVTFKASRDVENSQDIVHSCQLVNGVTSY